ncbi:hypothetical protein, partial [Klebsiella pneumoniae]|uniref:hypothetical protein n=1 Tax=Klebsiella pneumoniae TaxID=573 RepID=UPI003EC03A71
GSPHTRESFRLCGYVVGVAGGIVVGVSGRENINSATAEGIYTKFGMEVPHTPGKVLGYVVMWWALQVGLSWA